MSYAIIQAIAGLVSKARKGLTGKILITLSITLCDTDNFLLVFLVVEANDYNIFGKRLLFYTPKFQPKYVLKPSLNNTKGDQGTLIYFSFLFKLRIAVLKETAKKVSKLSFFTIACAENSSFL